MEVARKNLDYVDLSKKFTVNKIDYQKQFFPLYVSRLNEMTKLLKLKAREKWGAEYEIKKLCELREDSQKSFIIIGTIFKHQVFKPSILKEISEENQLAPQPSRYNYCDDEDKLILEDELQRVRLFGKIDKRKMATGVVCAILGNIEEDGRFDTEDILFYEGGPQKSLLLQNNCFIAVLSGLDQVNSHSFVDSLNLMQHWLSGNITGIKGVSSECVTRLIIAGNSVRTTAEPKTSSLQMKKTEYNNTLESVRAIDQWFASWSQVISVDVMPGEHDPANFLQPQQPFNRCIFSKARKYSSFKCVTNPYACEISGRLIIGTSGQNVQDILRSTKFEDPLEALRFTLKSSHISPTAPDTLACYPFTDCDPFIIKDCPHIYFAGNCEKFQTDLHVGSDKQRTRIVCVPSFSKSQEVVLININNLECFKISFKI